VLDVRRLRCDPDGVAAALGRRGVDRSEVAALQELDVAARAASLQRDEARADVKRLSKEVGAARKAGDVAAAERLQAQSRARGEQGVQAEASATALDEQLRQLLLVTPNTPDPSIPDGAGPVDCTSSHTCPSGASSATNTSNPAMPNRTAAASLPSSATRGLLFLST